MSTDPDHRQQEPLDHGTLRHAVKVLCARDAELAEVVRQHGAPPLWARPPGFATLLRIILEQQVSLASAGATYSRLQRAIGRVTFHRVARLSQRDLRGLGFTRQKAGYCLGLARLLANGQLNLRGMACTDDATTRRTLVAVRGIGPWTADIYMLMALGRSDVWPEGDLALATAVRRIKRMRSQPTADRLRRIAAAWSPWRSVAARILWHAYLSERRAQRRASGTTPT